ncbi:UNVERIFIED_CONTAM: hypothetical protein RMT77_008663 [Armadillidium vulgare]
MKPLISVTIIAFLLVLLVIPDFSTNGLELFPSPGLREPTYPRIPLYPGRYNPPNFPLVPTFPRRRIVIPHRYEHSPFSPDKWGPLKFR